MILRRSLTLLKICVDGSPSTARSLRPAGGVHPCRTLYYKPEKFLTPIMNPETVQDAITSEEHKDRIKFSQILPAPSYQSMSLFHHPMLLRFTNYLMKDANKVLANNLMTETFERMKRTQLKAWNSLETEEERAEIVCDPLAVFLSAIENTRPFLTLIPIKKGGITYQVPVPISENKSYFTGMKWLIVAGRDRPHRKVHFPENLAAELIDAHKNKGRVVQKKMDLHKQCENNRAYAHYRWS